MMIDRIMAVQSVSTISNRYPRLTKDGKGKSFGKLPSRPDEKNSGAKKSFSTKA